MSGSSVLDWSRFMRPSFFASSVSTEPPYAEPHVRWCERAEGVTPHPTRYANDCAPVYLDIDATGIVDGRYSLEEGIDSWIVVAW